MKKEKSNAPDKAAATAPPSSPVDAAAPPASAPSEPPSELEDLRAQLAAANAKIAVFESDKEAQSAEEVLVEQKMRAGLSREQATNVVRRQAAFDASDFGKSMRARHEAKQSMRA